MAGILSTLEILLTANTANFTQDMQNATESAAAGLDNVGDAATTAAAETESSFDKIKASAKTMAAGLLAALGTQQLIDWTMAHIDAAKEMNKLVETVGISKKELTAWQIAASKSGVETDRVTDAMAALNEKLLDASTGGEDAGNMFKALGVNIFDAKGQLKDASAALEDIGKASEKMADGSVKSAIASELMGDAGAELLPVLNNVTERLAAAKAEAEKMGLTFSEATDKDIKRLSMELDTAKNALQGVENKIFVGMLPSLTQMTKFTAAAASGLNDMAKDSALLKFAFNALNGVFFVTVSAIMTIGGVIGTVIEYIGAYTSSIGFILRGEYKEAWAVITGKEGFLDRIGEKWRNIKEHIDDMAISMRSVESSATNSAEKTKTAAELAAEAARAAAAARARQTLSDANAKPEKEKKEKKEKPKKEKEEKEEPDRFDYAKNLIQEFNDWSEQMDRDARDYSTAQYLQMQKDAAVIYDAMRADKSLLTTDLIGLDKLHNRSRYADLLEQSAVELLIFKDDNAAQATARAAEDDALKMQSEKRLQMLRDELAAKRALIDADAAAGLHTESEATAAKNALDAEYHEKTKQAESDTTEERRKNYARAASFFGSSLDQMAQGTGKAAKMAREINKARSLAEIGQNTASAAIAAYKAMVGIPVVGPALAVTAAGAAVAFGAMQAKAVMSDSPASGGSSSGPATPAMVVSGAQQAANTPPEPTQRTTIQIPADNLFTGRQMVDLLNEAIADGKRINGGLEFVGA